LLPKRPAEGELAEVEFKDFEYDSNQISLALAAMRNWAQKPIPARMQHRSGRS